MDRFNKIAAFLMLAVAHGVVSAEVNKITVIENGEESPLTVFNADEVDRVVVEHRSRTFTMERVTDKRAWHVLYGSIAMPYYKDYYTERDGNFAVAFDNRIDNAGWMSHVNDTYSRSQNLGDPYIVVDLGTEYPLARIGVRIGDPSDGGSFDVFPHHVDIYYTTENPAYTFNPDYVFTDTDHAIWQRYDGKVYKFDRKYTDAELAAGANRYTEWDLLNGRNIRGLSEEGNLVPEYLDLARRLKEHDARIDWHKFAEIDIEKRNPIGANSYMADLHEDGRPFQEAPRVRYIKVVLKPFEKGSNPDFEIDPEFNPDDPTFDFVYQGDRTKINEIRLDRLVSVDGLPVHFEPAAPSQYDDVSGEPYDYTKNIGADGEWLPERPYIHRYNRSMMLKFYMAEPDRATNTSKVYMTYAQALENIKKIDRISLGLKKIVYLVGWNSMGHDDRFPTVDVLNEALKRPEDATAAESLRWLQEEAGKYNTTVSVHVPLFDAFTNSPDWYSYMTRDLLCRGEDGSLISSGELMGYPLYHVNIVREWETGYLRRRIDRLTELCRLADAGTVHIDAFFPSESPYHGVTKEDSEKVMRKIIRYWRDLGVDVTAEFFSWQGNRDKMYGLQAAAWWNDVAFEDRVGSGFTPALACGGMSGYIGSYFKDSGFLLGDNMFGENILKAAIDENLSDDEVWARFRHDFCTTTLPAMLLWDLRVEDWYLHRDNESMVRYSKDFVARYNDVTGHGTIKNGAGDLVYRDGNDLFFYTTWGSGNPVAYSETGYDSRTWKLDPGWASGLTKVRVHEVTADGLVDKGDVEIVGGCITLSLSPRQMLVVSKP